MFEMEDDLNKKFVYGSRPQFCWEMEDKIILYVNITEDDLNYFWKLRLIELVG
jgi:hypothetical protein